MKGLNLFKPFCKGLNRFKPFRKGLNLFKPFHKGLNLFKPFHKGLNRFNTSLSRGVESIKYFLQEVFNKPNMSGWVY